MKMKVNLKKWHAVAWWKWDVNEECCGICRNEFEETCPECIIPGENCPPCFGRCDHIFHMHCLVKWLNSLKDKPHCPMCRQEWEFKS